MNSTPSERSIAASVAAYSLHAQRDSRELTVKAREAFFGKFVDEVDPDRKLPEDERLRRADAARKAHMKRMALKSVQARRRNKAARNSTAARATPATPPAGAARGGVRVQRGAPQPSTTTSDAGREHGVASATPPSKAEAASARNAKAAS